MRNFKRALSILLFAAILMVFEGIAEFLLSPVTFDHYLDYDLKQIEKNNQSVDMIFIGASRVYRSFIPSVFEEKFDDVDCAINCGSSNQTVDGSYYYLKDLLEKYTPKYVVMGIAYDQFLKTKNVNIQKRLIVYDRLKSPLIKMQFAKEAFDVSEYPYLLKSFRYKENVADIPEHLETKLSSEYRNGIDTSEEDHYSEKGFVYSTKGFKRGSINAHDVNQWTEDAINQSAFEYLDKIVDMCEEKGIQISLVSAPTTMSTVYCVKDYENINTCFSNYAKKRGIAYDNFNILKNRTELIPDEYMFDWNHVNDKGAQVVSDYYSDILIKRINGEDVSEYFYKNVAEMKKQNDYVITCRLWMQEATDEQVKVKVKSYQNSDIEPEYKFMVSTGNKEWKVVQDFGPANECIIPREIAGDKAKVRVFCRKKGNTISYEAYDTVTEK